MPETYYFPEYAYEQLQGSNDCDIWSKPIRVWKTLGKKAFYKVTLDDTTLETSDVVERGFYYPVRDQNLEATLESFEKAGQLSLENLD